MANCSICEFDASRTCISCQQHFCKKCVGQHVLTKTGYKHKIVPYIHVDNKLVLPYCESHNNQICELKCRQCQTHICPMCFANNHEEHTIDEIAILVEEKKEAIRNEICEIEASVLQLSDTEKQVNKNLLSTDENVGLILSEMEQQSLELKRSVDDIVCDYKDNVENATLENKGALLKFLEQIIKKKEFLQTTINEKTTILDGNIAGVILGYQTHFIDNNPPLLTFRPIGTFTRSEKSKEGLRDYLGKLSLQTCSSYGNLLYVEGNLDESTDNVEEVSTKRNILIVDRHEYYGKEAPLTAIQISDGRFGVVQRNKISPKRNNIPNHFQGWWLPIGTFDAEVILSPSNVDVGTYFISEECGTSFTLSIKKAHFVAQVKISKLNTSGDVYIRRGTCSL